MCATVRFFQVTRTDHPNGGHQQPLKRSLKTFKKGHDRKNLVFLFVGRCLFVPVKNAKGVLSPEEKQHPSGPVSVSGLLVCFCVEPEAVELYEEMPKMQVNPNIIHLNALLNAYETLGRNITYNLQFMGGFSVWFSTVSTILGVF